jgi:hypothetical protein
MLVGLAVVVPPPPPLPERVLVPLLLRPFAALQPQPAATDKTSAAKSAELRDRSVARAIPARWVVWVGFMSLLVRARDPQRS